MNLKILATITVLALTPITAFAMDCCCKDCGSCECCDKADKDAQTTEQQDGYNR